MIGSTIGQLSIDPGDGTLHYPLMVEGEGKENFLLNDKGSLKLIKKLDQAATYPLTVIASNEFGYATQAITIEVIESDKIGKAQLGRIAGATVTLSKLNSDKTYDLIHTTITNAEGDLNCIGNFELQESTLDDDGLYLYEVSGGVDVDMDDNGIADTNPTPHQGTLRLLAKGIWLKNVMHKVRITPLSEILYSYVENFSYNQLEAKLDEYAKILLKNSLNEDRVVDAKDVMIFDPLHDQESLYDTLIYNNTYQTLVNKIRNGEPYREDLLHAYVVESFQANAIEIVGSSVYTVDMLGSGEFAIYDLETKKKIGSLKLPYAPFDEDSHVIYVNLLENGVIAGSLEHWSYLIDVKNQMEPLLIGEPLIQYAILSGNYSRFAIGKSNAQNLFAKDRKVYFYDITMNVNTTKKIQIFTLEEDGSYRYLYTLDSKLNNIESLWVTDDWLYIIGDSTIHIFSKKDNISLNGSYSTLSVHGNILGIEEEILYMLDNSTLRLFDIHSPANPQWIEDIEVPFTYKLGIKTNGKYITTGSKIIDIAALRAVKNAT